MRSIWCEVVYFAVAIGCTRHLTSDLIRSRDREIDDVTKAVRTEVRAERAACRESIVAHNTGRIRPLRGSRVTSRCPTSARRRR